MLEASSPVNSMGQGYGIPSVRGISYKLTVAGKHQRISYRSYGIIDLPRMDCVAVEALRSKCLSLEINSPEKLPDQFNTIDPESIRKQERKNSAADVKLPF